MTINFNPRTREDFEALPYGTVCVNSDGSVYMRSKRASHDSGEEWQQHDEYKYPSCSSADMAEYSSGEETRVVWCPGVSKAGV